MLLEESDTDPFVELARDGVDEAPKQPLVGFLTLRGLHLPRTRDSLVEELLDVLEGVLIHFVYATHVSDGEVENGASLSHGPVKVPRLVYDNLDLLGLR